MGAVGEDEAALQEVALSVPQEVPFAERVLAEPRAPVVVDSEPVCRGVVTDTDAETSSIEIDLTIENEAGETRVLGTALVELPAK